MGSPSPVRATRRTSRARRIRSYLEERIGATLEWYVGCTCCEETLVNVRCDLDRVLAETCKVFGLERMPFLLKARFDGAELVVSTIRRDLS